MQSDQSSDERRQYFRIKNKILMRYQAIQSDRIEIQAMPHSQQSTTQMEILKGITQIQENNERFAMEFKGQDQPVTRHIQGISEQLDGLTARLLTRIDENYRDLVEVDISGGGLRFESGQSMGKNQMLNLEIILVPEYQTIQLLGKVVDCERESKASEQKHYLIAVKFTQIKESDRDAIIGHIFKTQSKHLRDCKENENYLS